MMELQKKPYPFQILTKVSILVVHSTHEQISEEIKISKNLKDNYHKINEKTQSFQLS